MSYDEYNLNLRPRHPQPPPSPPPFLESMVVNIDDLKLDDELLHHYLNTKAFLTLVQSDDSVPANQIAQLMNTLTAILQQIVKMRETIHNIERMKVLEETVIEVMKLQPDNIRDEFFEQLELALARIEK